LSNQTRYEGDPISTYIGFFGPNFRRIDLQLKTSKSGTDYIVEGKSRLYKKIRPFKGTMELIKVFLRPQQYITDSLYIGLFQTHLSEPGDKDGDGEFSGIFTLVFYKNSKGIQRFSTSSGDEPNFTNTFIGYWNRFNSDIHRQVIFSYWPSGLYTYLPYCEKVYDYDFDDYTVIKNEFLQYGWEDWDNHSNRQYKAEW
jgi:hypothetical protein